MMDGDVSFGASAGAWRDGAFVSVDGVTYEHAFENEQLAALVRKSVPSPSDASANTVFASELSFVTSGRHHRRVCGFSVYWHSHSEIVYILTGVTYCIKVYVECGRRLPDERHEVWGTPKLYLVRHAEKRHMAHRVSWPGANALFVRDVETALRLRYRPTLRVLQLRQNGDSNGKLEPWSTVATDVLASDETVSEDGEPRLSVGNQKDTLIFIEKLSVAYDRLRSPVALSATAASVVGQLSSSAADKKLRLLNDVPVCAFFLAEVCLYELGEENEAEGAMGVLFSRTVCPDYGFSKHRTVMRNARSIATAFNQLYLHRGRLAVQERRLDEKNQDVEWVRRYYDRYAGVSNLVVAHACRVVAVFRQSWTVPDRLEGVDVELLRDGRVSKEDVCLILRA